MKQYESIEIPGTFAYDCCPNCKGTMYRNSWHGTTPAFRLQCVQCGLLGHAGKSEEYPILFTPEFPVQYAPHPDYRDPTLPRTWTPSQENQQ